MHVWNVLHVARWKEQDAKNCHYGNIAQLCRAISSELRHVSTIGKNLLNSNISSKCPHNMMNFALLMAEICWRVWGTPANFNGFRVLAALLHGTLVVGVSQTLQHWAEGSTYICQGGHHAGHWPTFLVIKICLTLRSSPLTLFSDRSMHCSDFRKPAFWSRISPRRRMPLPAMLLRDKLRLVMFAATLEITGRIHCRPEECHTKLHNGWRKTMPSNKSQVNNYTYKALTLGQNNHFTDKLADSKFLDGRSLLICSLKFR